MANYNAKVLFECENPDMLRSKPFLSATSVLQSTIRVHYTILAGTNVIWTSAVPTAATDGYHIYINEVFFRSLPNASQRAFLLGHEVAHIMLKHCSRGKAYADRGYFRRVGNGTIPFCPRLWNEVGDAIINADLIAHGLEMIEGGILQEGVNREMWIDDMYLNLDWSDEAKKGGDKDGGNDSGDESSNQDDKPSDKATDGDSSDNSDDGSKGKSEQPDAESPDDSSDKDSGTGSEPSQLEGSTSEGHDIHLVPQYEGSEAEVAEQKNADDKAIEREIDYAIDDFNVSLEREDHDQKRPSTSIAASGGRARASKVSSTNWPAELANRATAKSAGSQPSWARINRRRFINTGVVSPTTKGTFNRIAFTADTSYSCMRFSDTVHRFFQEAASLVDSLEPKSGAVLIQCGDDVRQVDEVMSGSELLDIEIKEGGGTYMASAVEWLENNGIDCDLHLIFTDGWMTAEDYDICADAGAVLVLVQHPDYSTRKSLERSGIDYIVASDDLLAA